MADYLDRIIVGGGPGGLAVSCYLTRQTRSHVVIEQSGVPGKAWRNHRWDSFTLDTPNRQTGLPGAEYQGGAPDSFMSRQEIVEYSEEYLERFDPPVRSCIRATEMEQNSRGCSCLGHPIQKRGVTGYPGLCFVGIPWLHNAKSGLLFGVAEDAAYIAEKIIADDRSTTAARNGRSARR